MRKTILLLASTLALTTGCHRAEDISPEAHIFREIAVNIGENGDGTRSLVSIEAEDFQEACLFAFDAASNEVLTYPQHAGDLEGSKPVAIHTTQKSFNWALPIGRALDIYVIVNYGDDLRNTLDAYLSDQNLSKSTLEALTFTALDNVYMTDIEAAGIPMSGVVHANLTNENSPLNVTVKRLYARYNLWFDLSDLDAHKATLQALHIVTENVNTEVPFFQEGFKQTDRSKFKQYDRATSSDLDLVQQGGNGHQITLYVPENCQGDISGASDWKSVANLGSKVLNCSYVDMDVKIIDQDGLWKDYHVYLYLGTDFKSNFDVRRNYKTTVGIKIPYAPVDPSLDYFYWKSHELVTVSPGDMVTLDFNTNLSSSDVDFNFAFYESGSSASSAFQVMNMSSSNVTLKVADGLTAGTKFIVTGGSIAKNAQDQKPIEIASSSIILDDLVPEDGTMYLEFHFVTRVNGSNVYTTYRTDGDNWTIDESGQWYNSGYDLKVPVNRNGNTGVALDIIGYIWLDGEKVIINGQDGHIPGLICQISSRHSDDDRLEDTWSLREDFFWSTYGDYTGIDIYAEDDHDIGITASIYWADGPVQSDYITPAYDNGDAWMYLNARGLNNQWFGKEMTNSSSDNLQVKVGANGTRVRIYVEGDVWFNGLNYNVYDDETNFSCKIGNSTGWGIEGMRYPGGSDIVKVYGRQGQQVRYCRISYVQ